MAEIITPIFSETDIQVLEAFSKEEIQEYVDFFKEYKELMWLNSDTNQIVAESELRKAKVHIQPIPQYPEKLRRIGEKCLDIGVGCFNITNQEGFFQKDSIATLFPCTFFTPTLICAIFADAFARDRFCDGLLGFGVKDSIYLKMLLHLQDCYSMYQYFKEHQKQTEEKNR